MRDSRVSDGAFSHGSGVDGNSGEKSGSSGEFHLEYSFGVLVVLR